MAAAAAVVDEFVSKGAGFVEVRPPDHVWVARPTLDYARETLFSRLELNAREHPTREFLGTRTWNAAERRYGPYAWLTYGAAAAEIAAAGSGVAALAEGLVARGRFGGIFANNCAHWVLAQHALFRQGAGFVPLYATFGVQSLAFCVRQAELGVTFCGRDVLATIADTVAELVREQATNPLRIVVLLPRPPGPPLSAEAEAAEADAIGRMRGFGLKVVAWEDVVESGKLHPAESAAPVPDDIASIIFTSGTSGQPKGAVFTHRSWCVTADKPAQHPALLDLETNGHEEVHISYLPLSHVYELAFVGVMLRMCARIGFATSVARLLDDVQELHPTYILGVPRVWKKIHDKVMETVEGSWFFKRWLFNYAYRATDQADRTGVPTHIDYGKLVFSAVRNKLGGKCRFICNAAAPLPAELLRWLEIVLGLKHIINIYGLTECSGGVLSGVWPHSKANPTSVGYPCAHGLIRLVDVPEMGYSTAAHPPRGEILSHGESNMLGYYRNPQLTEEALERDATGRTWFRTGDIGQLNDDGTVSLIDRRKNLFKLAQGEYIPCELLETLFCHSSAVAQAWVYGESTDTFIVALVVPNFEHLAKAEALPSVLRELAAKSQNNLSGEDARRLCDAPEVKEYVFSELRRVAKDGGLPHFQVPHGILLEPDPWTVENGLTTPTFKLKRPALREKYAAQLQQLLQRVREEIAETLRHA